MILYHIDRTMKLESGSVINFQKVPKTANPEIIEYCDLHFPEGLSNIGLIYTRYAVPEECSYATQTSEIFLELYRQKNFPCLPSRFQSICASDTIDQAIEWFHMLKLTDANVAILKSNNYFKADATWRDLIAGNLSIASVENWSHNYWSGKMNAHCSRPEYLVKLPVKIHNVIPISSWT
ncbi:DUF2441 domain-containing protein [Aedoeadaptatus coxii]|uniref:DUF2441 domain-containing protein n=1 Tax=Aedoeadaptatus coxii TaxID=755172 RepID=UPI002AD3FD75|nr:DUF2441 domain-containing protein [Peptoniphilus coxii]